MRYGTRKNSRPDPSRGRRGRGRPPEDARGDSIPTGEELVLVRFKGHRKAYYHNRQGVPVGVGDYCLVEADRGRDLGRVCYIGPGKPRWWREARRQGVIGLAEANDLARLHDNRGDEWEFYDICREKVQDRGLKMELVTVERQWDHNKITFFFTADKRVDFRELVRDLASIFRTRIELRQIGVRDEARLKGGVGICGREFCCSTFLHDFIPVTLKMAKDQQLPLNPNKLSGLCGRLRCCLTYEHPSYAAAISRLPKVGATVQLNGQEGRVRKLDLVREIVTVHLPEVDQVVNVPPDQLQWDRDQDLPAPRRRPPRRRNSQRQN
jgi:cell fate regulator YaaT (PSP1 superfamily)